jgi:hypothetical protein
MVKKKKQKEFARATCRERNSGMKKTGWRYMKIA